MGNRVSFLTAKRIQHHETIDRMLGVEPLAQAAWRMLEADTRVRRFDECREFEEHIAPMLTRISWILGPSLARRIRLQAASHAETCTHLYSSTDDYSQSNLTKLRLLAWRLQRPGRNALPIPSKRPLPSIPSSRYRRTLATHSNRLVADIWAVVDSTESRSPEFYIGLRRALEDATGMLCGRLVAEIRAAHFVLMTTLHTTPNEAATRAKLQATCETLSSISVLLRVVEVEEERLGR